MRNSTIKIATEVLDVIFQETKVTFVQTDIESVAAKFEALNR